MIIILAVTQLLLMVSCTEKHDGVPHSIVKIVSFYSDRIKSVSEYDYHSENVYLFEMNDENRDQIVDWSLEYVVYNQKGYSLGAGYGNMSGGISWSEGVKDFVESSRFIRKLWEENVWQ